MLFSNFDFLQQNFAVISKTFLDNSDRATVSVLSHSGPARTLVAAGILLMVCLHSANLRVGTFLSSTEPILTQDRATLHIGAVKYIIVQDLLVY